MAIAPAGYHKTRLGLILIFAGGESRRWNATVIAATTLAGQQHVEARAARLASRAVAEALGNTPAVARQSYIDPRVFSRYAEGRVVDLYELPDDAWRARSRIESRVLELLDPDDRVARGS